MFRNINSAGVQHSWYPVGQTVETEAPARGERGIPALWGHGNAMLVELAEHVHGACPRCVRVHFLALRWSGPDLSVFQEARDCVSRGLVGRAERDPCADLPAGD